MGGKDGIEAPLFYRVRGGPGIAGRGGGTGEREPMVCLEACCGRAARLSGARDFLSHGAHNSAVECHLHTVEVVGSNPAVPTILKPYKNIDLGLVDKAKNPPKQGPAKGTLARVAFSGP